MKRFIVTGGYGFIGSNLIIYLIKKGFKVLNVDKLTYSANKFNLNNIKNSKNYLFLRCDINNKKKILNILKKFKPHGIFNLAADTHVDRSIENSSSFMHNNILGVYNLLEAVKEYENKLNNKIRFIQISTDEVYGDIDKNKRSSEKSKYSPSSPYAASKASSDHIVSAYEKTFGLDCVITNCSNNYGPRQFPEKLVPKIIYNVINNLPIPIYAKGKNIREWIYVEDHCEALLKIFYSGKKGENYNIGSGINCSNLKIAKEILKIFKEKFKINYKIKIQFVTDRPGHDFRYAINSQKIKKNLKWKAKINLKEGLKKTIEWYISNKIYFKNIDKKDVLRRIGL